jgi:outer membrane protein TolC
MTFNKKKIIFALVLNLCLSPALTIAAQTETNKETKAILLSLPDLLFEISKRNSTILSQELQWQIADQQEKSKEAIFEPIFYSTYTHTELNKPNTAQEQTYRLFEANYHEKTENYEAGIKGLLPTGGNYRVGFNGIERQSNIIELQKTYKTEYDNTFTITLIQPLLRDMGVDITLTQANIAKANQEIAFYTYRQQIIETAGTAAQAYWRLYGLQQMYKGWQESLKVAEDLLENTKYQVANGRIAETEIMAAKSGVALRQSKLLESKSDMQDAQTSLFNLLNISISENPQLVFNISPNVNTMEKVEVPKFEENFKVALGLWPPYLISQKKIEIADIQTNYSENQTLPRLDLIAGNPHAGLKANRGQALAQTFSGNHISWNVGVQLEVPIFGNEKAEAELQSAKFRSQQTRIELEPIKRELSNNLYAKINRLQNAKSNLVIAKDNARMANELLETEFERLKMGKSSNNDVLNKEEDVIHRKRDYLSSLVELKVAETLVDIANGSLFDKYNIHISKSDSDVILTKDSLDGSTIHSHN